MVCEDLFLGKRYDKNIQENTRKKNMVKRDHPDYPFYGWKIQMAYVVGKFMATYGIKVYDTLLTID